MSSNSPDTTPRIVVPPATPGTERLAPPSNAQEDGTIRLDPVVDDPSLSPDPSPRHSNDLYEQYAVLGKIGDGGMGVVYLARDRRLGRHVAIKRLKSSAQSVPSLKRRFLHEARAVAALANPHICHLYGLGEDAEGPYIVMEYVAGELPADPARPDAPPSPQTLESYIGLHGALLATEAIALMLKLCRAIAYAHTCGVVHRDLKPTNVLMDKSGEPKIVDFGLARLRPSEESKLTVPGEKLLSLGYGAPEQESDASVSDERADVYGLGALLYFVLTAQNPRYFRENDLPVSVRAALCKAMARDREQRWPSAQAFLEALASIQSSTQVETPTVKTTWRCKWCDTVNPLSTHYCAECGWDGGERCLECGADTHIGIPFCRICGANAREYEQVATTIQQTQDLLLDRQLESAIAQATRSIALEPAGPNGRRMLETLRDLRASLEKQRERRDQLSELIRMEMRAENYERARRFIEELRTLSADPKVCAAELAQIPERILLRDLEQVRRCFREQDWDQGARLLESVYRAGGAHRPECIKLEHQLKKHRIRSRLRQTTKTALATALFYILALPPVLSLGGPSPSPRLLLLFRPAGFLYRTPATGTILGRYAALWHLSEDARIRLEKGLTVVHEEDPQTGEPDPPVEEEPQTILLDLERTFLKQIREIQSDHLQNMETWPPDYRRALQVQRDHHQAVGDFTGWQTLSAELARFETNGGILPPAPDAPEALHKLQTEFITRIEGFHLSRARRLVATTKRHINELGSLLRDLTKAGKMEAAERVNREIMRLRADPDYLEAERKLSENDALGPDSDLAVLVPSAADGLGELAELRSSYENERRRIAEEFAPRLQAWPVQYADALRDLMEERQLAGDYLGWEAANFELDRFELDGTLEPDTGLLPTDSALDRVRQRFLRLRQEHAQNRARDIVRSTEEHLQKLDQLASEYTRARNIEAAAATTAEIRRMRSNSEYLSVLAKLKPDAGPPAGTAPPP